MDKFTSENIINEYGKAVSQGFRRAKKYFKN